MHSNSTLMFSLACCLLLGVSHLTQSECDHDPLMLGKFLRWMAAHDRHYSTAGERLRRFDVYSANMRHIEAANAAAAVTGRTYELGEGPFTDLTNEEFMARYTMHSPPPARPPVDDGGEQEAAVITTHAGPVHGAATAPTAGRVYHNLSTGAPPFWDWRASGAVTPVKNQQQCGSCWAFATIATIESLYEIKTHWLPTLSEQELVDCDTLDSGCRGGWPYRAMSWIALNGGVASESTYPYQAAQGTCDENKLKDHAVSITGYSFVEANSEVSLRNAVASQPVSVVIDASPDWQHYSRGIFNGPCGVSRSHAVAVVGYSKNDTTGAKYWIVKNSWGSIWGVGGYILMARDIGAPEGLCGIAMDASFPLM